MKRDGNLMVKSRLDMAAGLFLAGVGLFALWACWRLSMGTARIIGPGMFPMLAAVLICLLGAILVVKSLFVDGPAVEPMTFRAPFFLTLAMIAFGFTIRGFDLGYFKVPALGLLVAAPLSILISGLASAETRLKEILIYAIVLTGICCLFFKGVQLPASLGGFVFGLNLPMPLAPWLFGY